MALTGQADAHPGSRQWLHCRLTKCRSPPAAASYSLTTVKWPVSVTRVPAAGEAAGAGRPLASAQAASHARQPTQRVVSTSMAAASAAGTTCGEASSRPPARAVAPVTPATLKNVRRLSSIAVSSCGAVRTALATPERRRRSPPSP